MANLYDVIQTLTNGRGIKISFDGDNTMAHAVGPGELVSAMTNPNQLCVISMVSRPGAAYFLRYLELEHYTPETPRDALLQLYYYLIDDMLYFVVSVPAEDEALLEETAQATGMALKRGYQMYSIGGENGVTEVLPFCERAFVLENCKGHLVYTDHQAAVDQQEKDVYALETKHFGHPEFV
jgi:hypothetical protein